MHFRFATYTCAMPELPEVETVRRGLESRLIDATVADVIVRDRRLRWPIAADFEAQLRGQRIVAIERRSKYLLFRLAGAANSTLLAHLGMTGSFVVHAVNSPIAYKSHDHVDVVLTGRQESLVLRYNDPRRFGSMHHFTGLDAEQPLLAHLGPEPLTDALTDKYLYEQTRRVDVVAMVGRSDALLRRCNAATLQPALRHPALAAPPWRGAALRCEPCHAQQ